MSVVQPENSAKAVKQLRQAIFPEDEIADAEYLKKAKDMMKKLLKTDIYIKKVGTKGEMDFKNIDKARI